MSRTGLWRAFEILLLASSAIAGCARPSSPAGPDAGASPQAALPAVGARQADLTCRLVVGSSSANRYSVALSISNQRSTPLNLEYFHPLTFTLQASIGDRAVPLNDPPTDMPVEPRTLHVGSGQTVTLTTPLALSFGPGPDRARDSAPFHIWIQHAPARVKLSAERAFKNEPSLTCGGSIEP